MVIEVKTLVPVDFCSIKERLHRNVDLLLLYNEDLQERSHVRSTV